MPNVRPAGWWRDDTVEQLRNYQSWVYAAVNAIAQEVARQRPFHFVNTGQADRLRYLAGYGLTPGTRVTVRDRQPFDGPVTVEHDGNHHVLGAEIARVLLCSRPDV